jgi:protein-S-isoprenylcysteine O-methyltransferase Ste14
LNASPDSAQPRSGYAFFVFGRLVPAAAFVALLALQIRLLLPELAAALGHFPNADAIAFVLNRVLSILFVAGLALIYIARRPAVTGRHDLVAFAVSMYASFILLAFRPMALLLNVQPALNTSTLALEISDLLVIVGVGLSIYSLLFLRFNFSIMPEARHMISHGPYGIVRHPIYLGEILSGAGLVLALPGWFSLAVLLTFIGAQLYRTRIEEEVLASVFPDYEAYARKTRFRLIPGVI